jgi:hypothetical protein
MNIPSFIQAIEYFRATRIHCLPVGKTTVFEVNGKFCYILELDKPSPHRSGHAGPGRTGTFPTWRVIKHRLVYEHFWHNSVEVY